MYMYAHFSFVLTHLFFKNYYFMNGALHLQTCFEKHATYLQNTFRFFAGLWHEFNSIVTIMKKVRTPDHTATQIIDYIGQTGRLL